MIHSYVKINTVFQGNEFPATDTQRDREKEVKREKERNRTLSKVRLYVIWARNGNNNGNIIGDA